MVIFNLFSKGLSGEIICISETYFDSNTSPDDNNLKISGDNLMRSDHPSNNKRGGIRIYYKHFFTFENSQCSIFARMYYCEKYRNFT